MCKLKNSISNRYQMENTPVDIKKMLKKDRVTSSLFTGFTNKFIFHQLKNGFFK